MSVRRVQRQDPGSRVKREFWIVDVDLQFPNGKRKRVRKVSPIQTRRGAEQFERELRSSMLNGTFEKEEKQVPTLGDFSKEFLELHVRVHNKASTVANHEIILNKYLVPALGDLRLDQIGEQQVAKFRAAQKAAGLKNATVNNHLIVLRSLLGRAFDWNQISVVPKIKKLPKHLPPIRFLSFEEAERLNTAAKTVPEWYAPIVVALNTGMRLGELIALKWDDIDLTAGMLTVQRSDWQGSLNTPKSGKIRNVPLNAKAQTVLKAERHLRGPWVFCKEDGSRRTNVEFASGLQRVRKLAGLQGFEWHGLRHTFASHLAMRGVPMRAIQELLGHADLQMTLRYSHLTPDTTRRSVDSLLEAAPDRSRQHDGNGQDLEFDLDKRKAPICSIGASTSVGSGGRI